MGRAFEFRKERKLKRWGKMSKTFTKMGREITKAAKEGGGDPDANPKLRVLIQNAKAVNMPKDNIERAIKKATEKNTEDWDERVYDGYGPHGVAIVVETLTDNPTRTVANVRACFNKCEGNLGTTGSLDHVFERKCMFKIESGDINPEEFELEMIDYGAEEVDLDDEDNEIIIYGQFEDFGNIQSALDERNIEIKEANLERIPLSTVQLTEQQEEEVNKLIEKLEDDEDVQSVFHTMA